MPNLRNVLIQLFLILPLAASALGKQPLSPLYKFQFWAKNNGGSIKIEDPSIASGKGQVIKACRGIDLNLEPAWDITTGSSGVIVGIIDDGFAYTHPNLRPNIWNKLGYNFADNNGDPNSCLWDVDNSGHKTFGCGYWHGNMALGIIGARPDAKLGIAGINWRVSMMLLKVSNQNGVGASQKGRAAHVAQAVRYAVDHGARIINWSGFLEKHDPEGEDAITSAFLDAKTKGVLIVVAAGNGLIDMDKDRAHLPFPMNSDFDNVIYIANTDACGDLVDFEKKSATTPSGEKRVGGSNFGKRAFIATPAELGITTMSYQNGKGNYMLGGGTSDAAPMATGVAALVLSVNPKLDYVALKNVLCSTARKLPGLSDTTYCGGIIDAGAAVSLATSGAMKPKSR